MKKTQDTIALFFRDNLKFARETVRVYGIALYQFFTFCDKDYDQVVKKDIRAYLAGLGEQELMARTIHLKLAALKAFYRYCIEEGLLEKNPTFNIDFPQPKDSLPVYLDKAALAQLLELSRDTLRDRALVEALYSTGARISELLSIKLEDIKWDTQQIWIRKGKGNKERFVLFTTECSERLKEYLAKRNIESPYLFANQRGDHLSRIWAEKLFNRYSKELGYRVTPHTIRHTFAAHLAEKGMPQAHIADLLGHASLRSTGIYTGLNAETRKNQYDSYQTH